MCVLILYKYMYLWILGVIRYDYVEYLSPYVRTNMTDGANEALDAAKSGVERIASSVNICYVEYYYMYFLWHPKQIFVKDRQ